MSNLSLFLKGNKKVKENEKHVATTSICDEKGVPVPWEFRHVTSKESMRIREKCTVEMPVKGKPNVYRPKLDTDKYVEQLICKAAVFPNLNDAALQDSYGVKTLEDLLYCLVDEPGEYIDLCAWIQEFLGFESTQEKVDKAKN